MTSAIFDRYLKPWNRGIITSAEFANGLLNRLLEFSVDEIRRESRSVALSLPTLIREEFVALLSRIRDADYRHSMFMLGGPPTVCDPASLQAICDAVLP